MFSPLKKVSLLISILAGAFLFCTQTVRGQTDTLQREQLRSLEPIPSEPSDTLIVSEKDTNLNKKYHKSPRIAAISSAIVPGLGQAYNGKYYKIPVIYGAGTIMYYYFDRYNYNYQRIKKARRELKDTGVISDPELENYDDATLELNMNSFRRNRDYQLIFMGLLYVANIVDAMVDAYMYEFDVSDDLSMKIGPSFEPISTDMYSASAGLKLSFRF
jgi:hypothetical protein